MKTNNIMRAKEARRSFFEEYVTFEHLLRRLYKVQTKKDSKYMHFKEVAKKLQSERVYDFSSLSIQTVLNQINCRNWLAHTHGNSPASLKKIKLFNDIEMNNKEVLHLIDKIKKWNFA